MSTYLFKKAALVRNPPRVQIRSFIPPQMYQRYIDLSKNLYLARQTDNSLKTQVRIGQEDLLLRIEIKNLENPEDDTYWQAIQDLEKFGPISPIDLDRT